MASNASHRNTLSSARGFTLIEVLVALALTTLMMFLIWQLFMGSTRIIQHGIAMSDVIQHSRVASDQLALDADGMIGPSQNGVLVILNHEITAPMLKGKGSNADFSQVEEGVVSRAVRSDQLVFIRTVGDDERTIVPVGTNTFTSSEDVGSHARVWYGHLRRTSSVGMDNDMDPASSDDPTANGALGQPGATWTDTGNDFSSSGGGTFTYSNEMAHEWIMGRQALHLRDSPPSGSGDIRARGGFFNAGGISAGTNSRIMGYPAGSWNERYPPVAARYLFMGIADMAEFGLDSHGGTTGTGNQWGCMVGSASEDDEEERASSRLMSSYAAAVGNDDYKQRAYLYTYGAKRLRANPAPIRWEDSRYFTGKQLQAYQIAQAHPILTTGVSDIIVEFAADVVDDGNDGVPDGEPDVDASGGVVWYSHYNPPTSPAGFGLAGLSGGGYRAYDGAPATLNARGGANTAMNMPHATAGFVWRHDDTTANSEWPYMIKLRWRVHDRKGHLVQSDGQHGIWFEQILPVPRP